MSDSKGPPCPKKENRPPLKASQSASEPNSTGSKSLSAPDRWLSKEQVRFLLKAIASQRDEETRPLAEGLRRFFAFHLAAGKRIETFATCCQHHSSARVRATLRHSVRHHGATRLFPRSAVSPRRS